MSFFSPLEQFLIYKIFSFSLFGNDLSFSNSSLFAFLSIFFIFFMFNTILANSKLIPNAWQVLIENCYEFVYFSIVTENIKKDGSQYFPSLFCIFFFLLFSNLLGMIPFGFTITSHIIVTFGLALTFFVGINIIGLKKHGLHMLSLFLPAGAPLALAPLLVIIEIVSYSFRVISLALRLFANMMSGHCLLKILAGFAWTMFSSGGFLMLAHLVPLVVIFAIIGLECGIAFLQAYVFTLLLCIYLNDAISLH